MKKVLIIGSVLIIVLLAFILNRVDTARVDGIVEWGGNGSDKLPCPYGAHWNLLHGDDIESATIYVNGVAYEMSKHGGGGTWDAYSDEPLLDYPNVYVEYTGGHEPNDYFITLSHCNEGEDPTPTPTFTSTPTWTTSPTNTPTNTPTDTATPTFTPTSTEGPSPTPTDTPTQTPTSTEGPSPTPTDTPTPTETSVPTETPTVTPTRSGPTETPKPPKAGMAFSVNSKAYPSTVMGIMNANHNSYTIYYGVNASDGTLLLPSKEKGGAFYNNQIWLHRAWNSGWFNLKTGDILTITFSDGKNETYKVTGSSYEPYGKYFDDGKLHIVTCYGFTTWDGVEVFDLTVIPEKRNRE